MPVAMASAGMAPVIACVCLQRASFILRRLFFFFLRHAPSCGTVNIRYKTRLPSDFGPWRDQTTERGGKKELRDRSKERKKTKERVKENIGSLFQMTAGSSSSPRSLHVSSLGLICCF